MATTLFLALAGVYVLGVAGVVVIDAITQPGRYERGRLEARLALVRETTPMPDDLLPGATPASSPRRKRHRGRGGDACDPAPRSPDLKRERSHAPHSS